MTASRSLLDSTAVATLFHVYIVVGFEGVGLTDGPWAKIAHVNTSNIDSFGNTSFDSQPYACFMPVG